MTSNNNTPEKPLSCPVRPLCFICKAPRRETVYIEIDPGQEKPESAHVDTKICPSCRKDLKKAVIFIEIWQDVVGRHIPSGRWVLMSDDIAENLGFTIPEDKRIMVQAKTYGTLLRVVDEVQKQEKE